MRLRDVDWVLVGFLVVGFALIAFAWGWKAASGVLGVGLVTIAVTHIMASR